MFFSTEGTGVERVGCLHQVDRLGPEVALFRLVATISHKLTTIKELSLLICSKL